VLEEDVELGHLVTVSAGHNLMNQQNSPRIHLTLSNFFNQLSSKSACRYSPIPFIFFVSLTHHFPFHFIFLFYSRKARSLVIENKKKETLQCVIVVTLLSAVAKICLFLPTDSLCPPA